MTETAAPRTFAEAQGQLARSLPGYESRPQQVALAERVEALMARAAAHAPVRLLKDAPRPEHLWGQASTGCGKSLAYLIPAIQFTAEAPARRVVVSVTTRSLQAQLCTKDLPFLQEHLGVPFTWAQLQGRSRYFCLARSEGAEPVEVPSLGAMREQLAKGWSGLREELPFEVPDREWAMVRAEAEECKSNECSLAYKQGDEGCRAQHARAMALRAQVVVVNHALLCTDLVLHALGIPGMLGDYEALVLDEAHTLEEVAGDTIGAQITEGSFRSLTAEMRAWVQRHREDADIDGALVAATNAAQDLFGRLPEGRVREATLVEHAEVFRGLVGALEDLRTAWVGAAKLDQVGSDDYPRAKKRRDTVTRRLNKLAERYYEVIEADFADLVRWVEVERVQQRGRWESRKVLRTAPVSVAPFLDEHLFSRVPTALVSATLAVGGKFDYMDSRLGVGPADSIDVGTPFDYGRQARLYVPTHLPDPSGQTLKRWEAESAQEILELIRAAGGRTLVLFTSRNHMTSVVEQIGRRVPTKLLVQDGRVPVSKLAAEFVADETSVLFGLKSLMTGFDPKGRTCSLVIIAKMPFPVPTEPVTEARCEAIEARGGRAFSEYTVPVMSLVLQQAAGRLVRHRDDRGIVAILDPRISTKSYGKRILHDLPPMPSVANLDEAESFLKEYLDEPTRV